MTDRPYHHGHLRDTLLAEAERTLREQGIEQLSLRDLARQAGVSHAAPRRHFPDRQALLDALAGNGFARLGDEVAAAMEDAGPDIPGQLRAVATVYVRFATENAALMELMFTTKSAALPGAQPGGVQDASMHLFTVVGDLIRRGQAAGQLPPGDPEQLRLLLIATVQGIASLVSSGRAGPGQAGALIAEAVTLYTRGPRG
jgi:AcrR family transcriptional regulator